MQEKTNVRSCDRCVEQPQRITVQIEVTVKKEPWEKYVRMCKTAGWKSPGEFLSGTIDDQLDPLTSEFDPYPPLIDYFMNRNNDD